MSRTDHRTPVAPIAGVLAGTAMFAYALPALAGAWAPLRGPLGVRGLDVDRTRATRSPSTTVRTPRARPPCSRSSPRARSARRSSSSASRSGATPRSPARSPTPATRSALHCDRHRNLLRLTPWQVAQDLARALDSIESATGRTPRLYRPPYGVLNAAALLIARERGYRTMLWTPLGPGLGGVRDRRVDHEPGDGRRGRGIGAAAARRRRLLGAGLLAGARSQALPGILGAHGGPRPGAGHPVGASAGG